jgi:hypothetical protein
MVEVVVWRRFVVPAEVCPGTIISYPVLPYFFAHIRLQSRILLLLAIHTHFLASVRCYFFSQRRWALDYFGQHLYNGEQPRLAGRDFIQRESASRCRKSHKFQALLINDAFLVVNVHRSGRQRKKLAAACGASASLGARASARTHKTSANGPDEP